MGVELIITIITYFCTSLSVECHPGSTSSARVRSFYYGMYNGMYEPPTCSYGVGDRVALVFDHKARFDLETTGLIGTVRFVGTTSFPESEMLICRSSPPGEGFVFTFFSHLLPPYLTTFIHPSIPIPTYSLSFFLSFPVSGEFAPRTWCPRNHAVPCPGLLILLFFVSSHHLETLKACPP